VKGPVSKTGVGASGLGNAVFSPGSGAANPRLAKP
jgi:hypothetical protein